MEKIICAAVKTSTGKIYYGHRHSHAREAMHDELTWEMSRKEILEKVKYEQGFVSNLGNFLTREEAWKVAEAAGQIKQQSGGNGTLYSEDIY